jgi:hypothetical protein
MGYAANVEIPAISKTYNVSACVYFVPEGRITQLPTVRVSQDVDERNVSLLHSGEPDNWNCDDLSAAEEKEVKYF